MKSNNSRLSNGFANIIAIIIALVVLVGAGAGYWTVKEQKVEAPPASNTQAPVSDETASWKVNQNNCGASLYEVKFPNEWLAEQKNQYSDALKSSYYGDYNNEQFRFIISCGLVNNAPQSVGDALVSAGNDGIVLSERRLTLDSNEAIQMEKNLYLGSGNDEVIVTHLLKNGFLFNLSFRNVRTGWEISDRDRDFNTKILSTFKLVEDETAGWKTYTNRDLGLEFMYPSKYSVVVTKEPEDISGNPYDRIEIRKTDGRALVGFNNGAWDGGRPRINEQKMIPGTQIMKFPLGELTYDPENRLVGQFVYFFETLGLAKDYWQTSVVINIKDEKIADQIFSTFKFTK